MGSALTRTARSGTAKAARATPTPAKSQPNPKNDEWTALLRDMSGAIQSRRWDGSEIPRRGEKGEHPCARGATTRGKLPRRGFATVAQPQSEVLTPAQLSAVYKLQRSNAQVWKCFALAHRFDISPSDVSALLKHTRS